METEDAIAAARPTSTSKLLPFDSVAPTPACNCVATIAFEDNETQCLPLLGTSNSSTPEILLVPQPCLLAPPPSGTLQHQLRQQYSPFSSTQSSLQPVCRICSDTTPATPSGLPLSSVGMSVLISACRCTGSLQYVHPKCLRKWIEVCRKRKGGAGGRSESGDRPHDACELCGYVYRKHTALKLKGWRFPKVMMQDKCLHGTFLVCLLGMLASAIAMVICFMGNEEPFTATAATTSTRPLAAAVSIIGNNLSKEEIMSLACGITFFVSFFIAMAVEIKAKRTIYQIICRCVRHNTIWIIENYSAERDPLYNGHKGTLGK